MCVGGQRAALTPPHGLKERTQEASKAWTEQNTSVPVDPLTSEEKLWVMTHLWYKHFLYAASVRFSDYRVTTDCVAKHWSQ